MDRKPSSSFEQIKPFLRMLERSIDDARHRRLGSSAQENLDRPSVGHASPALDVAPAPAAEGPFGVEGDRPLRATPIRPKTQIRSTGTNFSTDGSV